MPEHAARKFRDAHGQMKIAGSNSARGIDVFFCLTSHTMLYDEWELAMG
jgi:hypothetical protein